MHPIEVARETAGAATEVLRTSFSGVHDLESVIQSERAADGRLVVSVRWSGGPTLAEARSVVAQPDTVRLERLRPYDDWMAALNAVRAPVRELVGVQRCSGYTTMAAVLMTPIGVLALPYGGAALELVLDAAATGAIPAPFTVADAAVWLSATNQAVRLAGLRLIGADTP